jgi:signal peptidase II
VTHSRTQLIAHFSAIALGVTTVSQIGSYLVNSSIPIGATIEWTTFIHLTHIRNMGGVFGMLQGSGWIFAILSLGLIAALVIYLFKNSSVQRYEYVCFGFIAGGGTSNILDRLIYGSVVDFINVQHIPFWHYIFNVADVMVHVGLWPMLYFSLFHGDTKTTGQNYPKL